ncbi:MAG: DUF58 domain-containing protein, partial [Pirellulaceae bacterium]|nr:DUF58 domain-containing protein [Pirellulaceae bacterium]
RQNWQRNLSGRQGGAAATARRSGLGEGEFFGLREWQTGDSPKWIHWRTTARLTKPAVRQFEQQRSFDLCVVVDAYCAPDLGDDDVETAISLAATIVSNITISPSNRVVLGVAGVVNDAVTGSSTDLAKLRMLEVLADVRTSQHPQLVDAIGQSLSLARSARDLVVISTRTKHEAFKKDTLGVDRLLNSHTIGAAGCSVQWINVRDDAVANWLAEEPV